MDGEKISIIVPVYNTKKYLKKCIGSILKQTYKNLELLLIDDGSTDESVEICQRYADDDSRVQVFSLTHQGVSAIRNFGLSRATGEYVCFVDSDDWISCDAIEKLYKKIISDNAQLCIGIVQTVSIYKPIYFQTNLQVIDCGQKKDLAEVMFMRNSPIGYMAAKIYAKKIIDENHLKFHEDMKCYEDACFTYEYLKYCQRISFINDTIYFYNRILQTAATRQYQSERNMWELYMYQKQMMLFEDKDIVAQDIAELMGAYILQRFENICNYYIEFIKDTKQCVQCLKETFELHQKYLAIINISRKKHGVRNDCYWELLLSRNYNELEELITRKNILQNKNSLKQELKKYIKKIYEKIIEFYWLEFQK